MAGPQAVPYGKYHVGVLHLRNLSDGWSPWSNGEVSVAQTERRAWTDNRDQPGKGEPHFGQQHVRKVVWLRTWRVSKPEVYSSADLTRVVQSLSILSGCSFSCGLWCWWVWDTGCTLEEGLLNRTHCVLVTRPVVFWAVFTNSLWGWYWALTSETKSKTYLSLLVWFEWIFKKKKRNKKCSLKRKTVLAQPRPVSNSHSPCLSKSLFYMTRCLGINWATISLSVWLLRGSYWAGALRASCCLSLLFVKSISVKTHSFIRKCLGSRNWLCHWINRRMRGWNLMLQTCVGVGVKKSQPLACHVRLKEKWLIRRESHETDSLSSFDWVGILKELLTAEKRRV